MASIESAEAQRPPVEQFKYSKRVVLKSILGREDGGIGLVGERVVVGGWVKSRREKADEGASSSLRPATELRPSRYFKAEVAEGQRVSCCEVLMSRVPLLRSMARLLLGWDGAASDRETDGSTVPSVSFLSINDGSCVSNLQIVVDSSMSLLSQVMSIGTSTLVEGVLQQPSTQGKHVVELKVEKVLHVGTVDLKKYPLAKTRLTLEFIRAYPHLRPRTTAGASLTRIRNTLSYATHNFFQNNGFLYVHMPIITTTDLGDCEKKFIVSTLFSKSDEIKHLSATSDREVLTIEAVKAAIKEKGKRVEELKRSDSNKEALLLALLDLQKANELAQQLEDQGNLSSPKVGEVDFSRDFFSRQAYLSVSAGLHLESHACALCSVYTFGPLFRADVPQSAKELAEMWMVEVELAFAELEDVMNCAEDFLKFLCQSILKNNLDDMKFMSKRIDKNSLDRLQSIASTPFTKITYTEALEVLNTATKKTFERKVEWGMNLSEEHESFLCDETYEGPVIIYEYPKEVKPFYVHVKEDGRTVSAFDIIVPKAGVLIRGSQREENIDRIRTRMDDLGLLKEQYEWYLDLRRHGTVKHSGFSLGFENLVMFVTGLGDIRDAIPFPRTRGSATA